VEALDGGVAALRLVEQTAVGARSACGHQARQDAGVALDQADRSIAEPDGRAGSLGQGEQHEPQTPREAGHGVGRAQRGERADHGGGAHAVGQPMRTRECVGAAGRDAHHREAVEAERVGELLDVAGERGHRSAGVAVGAPEAGAVDHQVAHPEVGDHRVQRRRGAQRRADRAVQVEDGKPVLGPGGGVAEAPPVAQPHPGLCSLGDRHGFSQKALLIATLGAFAAGDVSKS
jgi:hypothetical protein